MCPINALNFTDLHALIRVNIKQTSIWFCNPCDYQMFRTRWIIWLWMEIALIHNCLYLIVLFPCRTRSFILLLNIVVVKTILFSFKFGIQIKNTTLTGTLGRGQCSYVRNIKVNVYDLTINVWNITDKICSITSGSDMRWQNFVRKDICAYINEPCTSKYGQRYCNTCWTHIS